MKNLIVKNIQEFLSVIKMENGKYTTFKQNIILIEEQLFQIIKLLSYSMKQEQEEQI